MSSEVVSTKHTLSLGGDTVSGYCLLWRDKNNPDANGHWYTANSNFSIDKMIGIPVLLVHPDLGGMMEIGKVKDVSPDYYGLYLEIDVAPKRLMAMVLSLLTAKQFFLTIATDQQMDVEIGGDGFVIRYPITAIPMMTQDQRPITGQ